MTSYLLFGDSLRNPEIRHEVGEAVADPLVFIDHDGKRIVVVSALEEEIFAKREDVVDEVWVNQELGFDELVMDDSFPDELLEPELVLQAVTRVGASSIVVPATFPVQVADHLRAKKIDVQVDPRSWWGRRRRKTPWELEGVERAQRAAETAMLTAARMLREAEPTSEGLLRFEGEILTAELVREAMLAELVVQGAETDTVLVHSGDACLHGHEEGMGPILPDRSLIVDCFPRDRRSGAYSDMTRTFVPGRPSDELTKLHDHCRVALDIALESLKPGRDDAFRRVSDYFHDKGFPTQAHHPPGTRLTEGFSHSLGHGVGLEVHERPKMGRRSEPLVEGDVVAIEPGLYFEGVGGVRLEDTVLVTSQGVEHFTDPFPYDLVP